MLNKIKKNILPMLDTLGDALTQYLAQPMDELFSGITQFISAINISAQGDSDEAVVLSERLQASLTHPVLSEVERLYNEYCIVIENLPVQYKVVFLPYYDNTWDSLASVYEAFAADPMFVTEIVIIPIRRNTPTGWKLVYEDYLTPQGIPNTPFSSYSFENDLPDFVFYNNPYDGVNIEKFQSQNIKPYIGYMVYIPYYLYTHPIVAKEKLKYQIEKYTLLQGHDNADVFIVQGKSFFNAFSKRSRNGSKMITLGNPKTDYIYRHKTRWQRHPEWEKTFRNKHVLFLNTHYSSVIHNPWKRWMPNIFEHIETSDNLALIWRPHPQSFLMLGEGSQTEGEVMFRKLLERAEKSSRIILDRTRSAVSAMMYSEAILTQQSSIVAEAIFMDKPILLFAMDERERLPEERYADYFTPQYFEKLHRLRKYDTRHLFLRDSVCARGMNRPLKQGEDFIEYLDGACIFEFIEDIIDGKDTKKELRALFREQLFVNCDGTCGQKVRDYIVGLINA